MGILFLLTWHACLEIFNNLSSLGIFKVSEQQTALEKAGVPGFYASTNPQEVQSQMYLLGFIQRLSEKYGPSQTSF